ncbi:LrgB family protein [Gallaecimonas kandeliae]|uniref:LrgB family protein n=1 Tax=Gallaecimonas kandeliae TaxID=3029055 RepID=UPI002647A7CB|nr:LrgB family protein [Gallaecimonas kandeliae]WKE66918.1 LrgB family protein [Gallaecimonas kandeliae]
MIETALLALTLALYWGFRTLQAKVKSPLLNPVLLAIACLVPLLIYCHIPYERYMAGGRFINLFLEPAVVALAYPLYQQLALIRAQWKALLVTLLLGVLLALTLTVLLAWALGADKTVALSLAPKAVTTPIAMGVSQKLGGIAPLTAVLVILAGIAGAVLGPWILDKAGVKSPEARGLAMGCAAHAVGTARMVEESPEAAAFSSLALSLCGILTALLAPLLVPLLTEWMT